MAFSYDARNLERLSTYQAARDFYNKAHVFPDAIHRALDTPKKPHITIRMLDDGSLACRMHDTDVVTYHPDNDITVRGWSSISTDNFANALLYFTNIYPYFMKGQIRVDGKYYQIPMNKPIRLTYRDYLAYEMPDVGEHTIPYVKYVLDRKKANTVLKEQKFKTFENWVRMFVIARQGQICQWDNGNPTWTQIWGGRGFLTRSPHHQEIIRLYAEGPRSWELLLSIDTGSVDVTKTISRVKIQLLKEGGCIERTELPYCFDVNEVSSCYRSHKYA